MKKEHKECECMCHHKSWNKKEHGTMDWCAGNCRKLAPKVATSEKGKGYKTSCCGTRAFILNGEVKEIKEIECNNCGRPCDIASKVTPHESEDWEEEFNDIFRKNWTEPKWEFDSYINLVDHVKKWQELIKDFIKSISSKAYQRGYEKCWNEFKDMDAYQLGYQRGREEGLTKTAEKTLTEIMMDDKENEFYVKAKEKYRKQVTDEVLSLAVQEIGKRKITPQEVEPMRYMNVEEGFEASKKIFESIISQLKQ